MMNNFEKIKIKWWWRLLPTKKLIKKLKENVFLNQQFSSETNKILVENFELKIIEKIKELQKKDDDFKLLSQKNKKLEEEKETLRNYKIKYELLEKEFKEETKKKENLGNEIKQIREQKKDIEKIYQDLHNKIDFISNRVNDDSKILNQFDKNFLLSNNKEIGTFCEKLIEQNFDRYGIGKEYWTPQLRTKGGRVDIGFRLNPKENKWIPIDSKKIEFKIDDNKNPIINNEIINKVKSRAKEVTKYLNQENTTSIGIMVIHDDNLYLEISRKYPNEIINIYEKHNVVVVSINLVLQWAYFLWKTLMFSVKIRNDIEIVKEMEKLFKLVTKYMNDVKEAKEKLYYAIDVHYDKIKQSHKKLLNDLNLSEDDLCNIKPDKKVKKETYI